ncbi:YopX family protein [Streptococcus suis]|uniref:YopX family protein n=1 Tax=Streptococcus suis TaxID=1307 RepID=UPI001EE8464F|nr:YopX family protein [Streptococcus suis]MBS8059649.1 hypothetical protein [Streptococcus suis]MCL4901349.1 YopX family protein [Streptococcus suis]HEM2820661.1 hypothetical protein [Streptococcus suis]
MVVPKFRAWDKMHNEWSNGFFIYSEGGLYTPNYGFNRKHLKNRTDVYPIAKQERFILMHSTGLFDVNGKEIFEGDVVHAYSESARLIGVIEYFDNAYCIKTKNGIYNSLWINAEYYEVIGNIYENPELVEALND